VFAFEVIRRSGEQALAYYGKGRPDAKFDEGLVTEAEVHLGEFFRDQLLAHFPDHQIYRNEERKTGTAMRERDTSGFTTRWTA
jgi:fructose-1,6-bisphosphatase/inositol monophosphatase family enzyme